MKSNGGGVTRAGEIRQAYQWKLLTWLVRLILSKQLLHVYEPQLFIVEKVGKQTGPMKDGESR
jgi:hypothetical protein